ncbi:MAG: hypothetical protein JXA16_11265, partial [Bacteroidales bacterium]|nr:hypothetical protein [Bacteroidales bacterium]
LIDGVRKIVGILNNQTKIIQIKDEQIKKIDAFVAPVVTSIYVVADENEENLIRKNVRKSKGLEMEGFGVFQAVFEAPEEYKPKAILIKSVSDHGNINKNKNAENRKLAAFTSAYFFLKHLELAEVESLDKKNNFEILSSDKYVFVPLDESEARSKIYKNKLTELFESADEGSSIRFISITAKSDLEEPAVASEKKYLQTAFEKNIQFQGILVDPFGYEASFRNSIESPGASTENTLLCRGSESLKISLKTEFWEKGKIELRHAKVGLSFKLWLSDKIAIIEPYHFGRPSKNSRGGLCGFSQIYYMKDTIEYKILEDHFNKLWGNSTEFWPKQIKYPEVDSTGLIKKIKTLFNL